MLIIACSTCGAKLRGNESLVGKKGKCPKCGFVFVFFASPPTPPPAVDPPSVAPPPPLAATDSPAEQIVPPPNATITPSEMPSELSQQAPATRFQTDLAILYRELGIRDEVDPLPTLAALFDARRRAAADRQRRFADDLAQL